ncbi:MAG: hypothetical protein U0694_21085 [Anaerolineae bacterium]
MAILPWSPLAGGILAGRYSSNGKGGNFPGGSRAERMGTIFRIVSRRALLMWLNK